uniref:Co-chaperone protein p23 n=1 Tax=Davidia involucrata TaxID=16924 RepID=A0A5B7AFB5_DAVIN
MSRHPEVKWAQRVDKVYITVLLPDAKNAKVNLEPVGVFTFSASAGAEDHLYELKLDLYDKVDVEESKINIGLRTVFCVLEKAEKKWWKKLLRGDDKAPHYVKVDWDKWADEDDDTGPADVDMGGMEGLGGMGGMGGMDFSKFANMGGMGDMGDDAIGDDFDDSDDEDQEMAKPGEQNTVKAGREAKSEEHVSSEVEGAPEGKADGAPGT